MRKSVKIIANNLYILKMVQKASPWRVFLDFLMTFLAVGTNFLFNVYLIRLVLNGMQRGLTFNEVLKYILAIGVILIAYYISLNLYNELFIPISDKAIYRYIQKRVFSQARVVDLSCYEDSDFYNQYTKTIDGTSKITGEILQTIQIWLEAVLTICSTSLVIFLIDPIFILFTAVPVAYTLLTGKKLNQLYYGRSMEMLEKSRKRDYVKRVFYLSDYAKELRMTGISKVLFGRFFDAIEDTKAVIRSYGKRITGWDYFALVIQRVFLFIGSIIYSTYKTVVTGTMLLGDCVIVVNNVVSTASAIKDVVNGYIQMHSNALTVSHIRDFLEYEPKIKEEAGKLDAASVVPEITLRDVSFKYSDSNKEVLRNISFEIKPGEKIALVGHNGAGKTTLVKLLLRLYDPTRGKIELNGKDIREYGLSGYRKLYVTVFQQFKIFATDIVRNVWMKEEITDNERELAIAGMKNSGIYERIISLSKGMDTVLTHEFDEDGVVFSGGESQKIAIARAFTQPSKIIIMDEPSSALDPIAEYNMYQAMMKACANKSVIYISHRLASAVLADKVFLMENGEIVEQGSHSELLALGGKYAKMWQMQSEQYTKEGKI